MGTPLKFTPKLQDAFLCVLESTASPKKAAETIGVPRVTVFDRKAKDPEFRKRWEAAMEIALDAMMDEGYRRAVLGVDEPVIYQGQLATYKDKVSGEDSPLTVKRYSDRLLEVLLKHRYGDEMADRLRIKVDDTGLSVDALMKMSSEDRQALTALLGKYHAANNDGGSDDE